MHRYVLSASVFAVPVLAWLAGLGVPTQPIRADSEPAELLGVGGALSNWHVQHLCSEPASGFKFHVGVDSAAVAQVSHDPGDNPWSSIGMQPLPGSGLPLTEISWTDPPGPNADLIPGAKWSSSWAHFGYSLQPGVPEPSSIVGIWTVPNATATCTVDAATLLSWVTPTPTPRLSRDGAIDVPSAPDSLQHAEDVVAIIANTNPYAVSVLRRAVYSPHVIELADLSPGAYIDVHPNATAVDPEPADIAPGEVLTYTFAAASDPSLLGVALVYTASHGVPTVISYVHYGAVNFRDSERNATITPTPSPTSTPRFTWTVFLPDLGRPGRATAFRPTPTTTPTPRRAIAEG